MKQINLKIHYSFLYRTDTYIQVPDEIEEQLKQFDRQSHADYERRRVYKAYFSLDSNDEIELKCNFTVESPENIYEHKKDKEVLYEALMLLPVKQKERIYAHYYLGLGCTTIAKHEGVNKSVVSRSIKQALRNLKNILSEWQRNNKKSAD